MHAGKFKVSDNSRGVLCPRDVSSTSGLNYRYATTTKTFICIYLHQRAGYQTIPRSETPLKICGNLVMDYLPIQGE